MLNFFSPRAALMHTSSDPQVFCIFLMTTAACFFGVLLGELQTVYTSGSSKRREAEDHVDSVVTFLKGHGFVPTRIRMRACRTCWVSAQEMHCDHMDDSAVLAVCFALSQSQIFHLQQPLSHASSAPIFLIFPPPPHALSAGCPGKSKTGSGNGLSSTSSSGSGTTRWCRATCVPTLLLGAHSWHRQCE